MGAIAPVPRLSPAHLSSMQAIMQHTVTALAHEGRPFVGVLYGGFMLPRRPNPTGVEVEVEVDTEDGPQVLEFNCRMGDPETQSVLSLLDADLLSIMKQVGRLSAQIIF
jgi:phosphoribosylamine-glycine ligase